MSSLINSRISSGGVRRPRRICQRRGGWPAKSSSSSRMGQGGNGGNHVTEEHYRAADREWKLAAAAVQSARSERRQARPLKITEADALDYTNNLVAHMHEGDV